MLLKIDVREQELITQCQELIKNIPAFQSIRLETASLPVGDVIITNDTTGEDVLIIERKSLADLSASIKDGRYEEQSYRLNGLDHHNHNIIYLIEGDLTKFNSMSARIDRMTIYSAMLSINYYKGFSLMRSVSITETATIVCNMVAKISKETDKGRRGFYPLPTVSPATAETTEDTPTTVSEQDGEKAYCNVVKKVKKDNITENNIGEIMLCQIPSISSATALAILAKFGTISNLITSVKSDPNCLNDVCTTDAKGKSRKISKTCVANICRFLQ